MQFKSFFEKIFKKKGKKRHLTKNLLKIAKPPNFLWQRKKILNETQPHIGDVYGARVLIYSINKLDY